MALEWSVSLAPRKKLGFVSASRLCFVYAQVFQYPKGLLEKAASRIIAVNLDHGKQDQSQEVLL